MSNRMTFDEVAAAMTEFHKMRAKFAQIGTVLSNPKNGWTTLAKLMDEVQFGPREFTPKQFNKMWKGFSKDRKVEYVLFLLLN